MIFYLIYFKIIIIKILRQIIYYIYTFVKNESLFAQKFDPSFFFF